MKKGFTLTEILITMGIIGVVAALAVPNISAKINRNTIGVTLARAVELTETGFANVFQIARENALRANAAAGGNINIDPSSVNTFSSLTMNIVDPNDWQNDRDVIGHFDLLTEDDSDNNVSKIIKSSIGIETADNDNYGFYNNPGDLFADGFIVAPNLFRFKKMNVYMMFDNGNQNDNNFFANLNISDNTDDVVIRRIYFDVNGANNPNRIGEDIFLFGLTDSGHLVPAGSQAYNNNIWNDNIQMRCGGNTIPANDNDRLSCAARVVQDGWRVNYSF